MITVKDVIKALETMPSTMSVKNVIVAPFDEKWVMVFPNGGEPITCHLE